MSSAFCKPCTERVSQGPPIEPSSIEDVTEFPVPGCCSIRWELVFGAYCRQSVCAENQDSWFAVQIPYQNPETKRQKNKERNVRPKAPKKIWGGWLPSEDISEGENKRLPNKVEPRRSSEQVKGVQDTTATAVGICSDREIWVFGVLDGHGYGGRLASQEAAKVLATNIANSKFCSKVNQTTPASEEKDSNQCVKGTPAIWSEFTARITESYPLAHQKILQCNFKLGKDFGSTCTSVVLTGRHLLVSNCGDSSAILIRVDHYPELEDEKYMPKEHVNRPRLSYKTLRLTVSHTLHLNSERTRVFEEGKGNIVRGDGNILRLIPIGMSYLEAKQKGLSINMSRSLGHMKLTDCGLCPQPDHFVLDLGTVANDILIEKEIPPPTPLTPKLLSEGEEEKFKLILPLMSPGIATKQTSTSSVFRNKRTRLSSGEIEISPTFKYPKNGDLNQAKVSNEIEIPLGNLLKVDKINKSEAFNRRRDTRLSRREPRSPTTPGSMKGVVPDELQGEQITAPRAALDGVTVARHKRFESVCHPEARPQRFESDDQPEVIISNSGSEILDDSFTEASKGDVSQTEVSETKTYPFRSKIETKVSTPTRGSLQRRSPRKVPLKFEELKKETETDESQKTDTSLFIVIVSDGISDVFTPENLGKLVSKLSKEPPAHIAKQLTLLAEKRREHFKVRYDNCTAVVINLKQPKVAED